MQPPDLVAVFLRPFNTTGIDYMVTGSVAAAIYGEPRLTQDVDLVIALAPEAALALAVAFPSAGYYVPPEESLVQESLRESGGHFNLLHLDSGLRADCYLPGESALAQWGLLNRRQMTVGADEVWVASPEYVILSKLMYFQDGGGEKHLQDIVRMLRVSGASIDRDTIASWVARLGLEATWLRLESGAVSYPTSPLRSPPGTAEQLLEQEREEDRLQ